MELENNSSRDLMRTPKIFFLTCMPLTEPKSASMAFMSVLLERYPERFAWFSLRGQAEPEWNPHKIPYASCPSPRRPARSPVLRLVLAYFLWPIVQAFRAARFARENGCEVVLADLAFEAVVTGRLSAKLSGLPLLVNVHDDPVNRLRVKGHPGWFLRWYEKQFAKTLQSAQRVGVISDYMGEVYQQRYGVHTTTLYIGVEAHKCLQLRCPSEEGARVILSLGSQNSAENWNLLIKAVQLLNTQAGEQKYRILHIGKLSPTLARPPEVEVSGWLPDEDFLRELDRTDICFLNASFSPEQAEVGRLSFPLKIHSYIQSQRPMLALGSSDSAVARFVREHRAGEICCQPDAGALADVIQSLCSDLESCKRALEGVAKLRQSFDRERFFETFETFIGRDV